MPIIKVGSNRVVADEPEPDDTHVRVLWLGPTQDGLHHKQFWGPLRPIEDYDEAVAWARGVAGQMAHTMYVVPMTGAEVLGFEDVQRAVGDMTDQQRGDMRRLLVATLAEVMRDSGDPAVRTEAYDILKDMKVVRP